MKTSFFTSVLLALTASAVPLVDVEVDAVLDTRQATSNGPFQFTSTYRVVATPNQVVNGTSPTGGQPGTRGVYILGLNSNTNTICYNITLTNFKGGYSSPAVTATHLHQAARGQSGPPRIAFPNPRANLGGPNERVRTGCLTGPFRTQLDDPATGQDSGIGFHVRQIEANPAGFFCDVHSSLATAGAVRGQIA